MIVEDESFVAKDIADCMLKKGFNISDIYATGEQAVEQVKQSAPNLIFMDIRLKGDMNGIEAAKQINTISDVPIIFLSAYADREFIDQAKETNAYAYLVKPFKDQDLITNTEIALSRHRKEKQLKNNSNEREKVSEMLEQVKITLERAKRAKESFIEQISHEIKTPLNGIIGPAQLLMMDPSLSNHHQEYLMMIQNSCLWLDRIMTDILEICELDAKNITVVNQPFNLRGNVIEIIEMMRVQSEKKHIPLALEIDKEIPDELIGDSVRLRQILVKLLGNAIKFTREGSIKIKINHFETDYGVFMIKFEIEDTGIGIPREMIDHIFEKFSRLNNSWNSEFGGLGLGLASAKALVTSLHGSIQVESSSENGSVFSFQIPFFKVVQ